MCLYLQSAKMQHHALPAQVRHARQPNAKLQFSSGNLFNRQKSLQCVAVRSLLDAQPVTMDYAPGKLEGQVCAASISVNVQRVRLS